MKLFTPNRFLVRNFILNLSLVFVLLLSVGKGWGQNVTVSGALTGNGNYATLGAAITGIGTSQSGANVIIDIVNNTTEGSGSIVIGAGTWATLTIRPSGGGARTITAATTAGNPMIDLNGADNVTINGLNTGGNSLTISNTTASATSGTSTIRFLADATSNTITNCTILGSSTGPTTTNTGTFFFSTSTTTGNDNNTISNCNIGPAGANLPSKAIYGNGSTTTVTRANSGISIIGNNIYDYYLSGAHAAIYTNDGNTDWTISNNKFYQTTSRTFSASTGSVIFISGSTTANNNNLISGNTIGFANSSGTGSYTLIFVSGSIFIPINISSAGTTTATSIQGNTISGISISGVGNGTSSSSPFRGIYVGAGLTTIGDVTGNTIGSLTTTGAISYSSSSTITSDVIGMFNFGVSNWTTNNNNIGGFTVSNSSTGATNFYGLRCNTNTSSTWTCNNNVIGGTVANSISSTSTATGTIVNGILNSSPLGTFTSNTIRNLTVAGGTGTTSSASMIGICVTSAVNHTVSQNQIFNLTNSNTTAATTVSGIQFTGGASNLVDRNLIYGLSSSTNSTSAEVNGIRVSGGTTTYRNNMIALGSGISNAIGSAAANSGTTGINGFNGALGTDNFWHNTVYIGGSVTAGTGASYAFNGTQTTNTRSFRNNIFVNARSNSGSTGKNYAIKINGSTANPTGLTLNNNIYFTSGTGGVFGYFNSADVPSLVAWKVALGQDAGSFESDPQFVNPTSTPPDLHINGSNQTNAESLGFELGVTTDYDGETRSALSPVDIGADAFLAIVTCASTPSPTSGTINVSLSPTISWAAATNATGYDVYLGTTSGSLALVSNNQAGLSYTLSTALSASTQYYWRIVPRNGTNYASGCTEWSFTTQAATPTLSTTALSSFGNQCINTISLANSFNLSGIYLTSDDIVVGPLSGFVFSSTNNGTYTSTLTISQPGGTLASTPIFVQFTPTSVASFNGNIPISGGGLTTAISLAAVGTGVNTAATASTGISSSITATTATVAGSFVANCQTITAYGIEYSTTNGFTNGSGTQVSSANQSSGSFTSSLTGLTNNVTYYYKAFATYGSTTVYGTQSSFTTPQVCSIALQEAFSTTTTPAGWGSSSFYVSSAISGVSTSFTSNYMVVNLYSSTTSANFTTCNYGPIGTNANLTFNYSVTNYSSPYAAPAVGWGNIQVQISTDFGATYTTINTITASASSQTPVNISLSSYAGQYAKFKFIGTWLTGDYNVVIDDINAIAPCVAPNQPTNLTFTNVGPTQMTVNYTASSSSPTGYLMVRYPAGSTPSSPVNGTTYSAGTALGSGTITYVGSNVSNVITGLSINTNYDFYVYAYNAVTCTNGPVYNTTSPLSGSQSTTVCPTLSSIVTIGQGYDYATLTDAIVILNGCGITQPTILELQSNYVSTNEAFPITLGAITGASVTNTITVRPASSVSSALTITSSNTTGTINHNGGNFFVFDGRPGGLGTSKFITIENTSSSGYAVIFQNESSNNTLRYLTIKGQNTSTSSGTIVFSTTTGTNGNDNNTIEFNDICAVNASTATPTNGIYALGTTTNSTVNNSNNSISNNSIRDFYNSTSTTNAGMGINIGVGNTDWSISSNSIFQTQARTTFGAAATFSGIYIANTSGNNFNITSNTIGGTALNAGGGAMTINASTTVLMRLMYISTGTTSVTTINNNNLKNISFTTTSGSTVNSLISILNGTVNCNNNTLGDATSSNNIVFNTSGTSAVCSGILAGTGTTAQGVITISGNTIAGISVGGGGTCELRLIAFQSSGITPSTQFTVSNNILGNSSVSNSINNSNNSIIYGIVGFASHTTSTNSITGNTLAGFQSTSTGSNASIYGILAQGSTGGKYNTSNNSISKLQSSGGTLISGVYHTAATTVDQVVASNNVNELTHTGTGTASVIGIFYSGPTTGTNEIKSNLVHSLAAATLGSTLTGIQIADAGNASVYNNMIRLGINTAGSDVTTNAIVYGINQSGTTSNHSIYFNSIYVGGSGVNSGSNNTASLWSAATSGTRVIQNNIFSNLRANGAGTGKHYSIRIAGLTGLTINNNDYWNGASFLALNNAADVTSFTAWQTATSQDLFSVSVNPNFVNPTGNSSSLDLHINNATSSALESGGANVSTILTDRDGHVRPGPVGSSNGGGTSSDIGADEFDGIPGYTCTTPISAGNTVTSSSVICAGNSVNLSLTGVSIAGTGNVYQWSSSSDNSSFSPINGATSATYSSANLSQTTYFNCVITCLANSGSATSVTTTITVNPVPTTPSANSTSICGSQNATCYVTGSGTLGNTFKWYTVPTGGTAITGQTAATLSAYLITSTTTLYASEANANCESPRVAVTQTVTPPPAVTTSASSATICAGTNTTLSASSTNPGYSYSWSNGLGSGSSVTASPTTNTTYSVTATDNSNGCVNTANVSVSVNPLPTAISLTPNTTQNLCAGNVTSINVISNLFSQNFESSSVGLTPSSSSTATINSTYFSEGSKSILFNTTLTSSTLSLTLDNLIDLTSFSSATINFSHIAAMESGSSMTDLGFLEYSTDGGVNWLDFPVASYIGAASSALFSSSRVRFSTTSYTDWSSVLTSSTSLPTNSMWKTEVFNIPSSALTSNQFKFRFRYKTDVSVFYYGWLIDNVYISGTPNNISFSPITDLYTNSGATIAYTGNPSTVYSKPTANRTYTATATTAAGCSTTASVTINVAAPTTQSVASTDYIWKGTTSTAWGTTTNWTQFDGTNYTTPSAAPTTTTTSVVVIPQNNACVQNQPLIGSSAISVQDLKIESGATTTLNSGAQLTVSGTLTNNGTLTLESGATFLQGTSLAGSGTYNVKQAVTGAGGAGSAPTGRFWYMGVPLNSLTRGAAFGTAGTDNRLWSWTEGTGWSSQLPDNTPLYPTTGYVFRTSAPSTTLNFSGTSLYSSDASISGLTNTTGAFAGCHLISNPYTAYLDWESVIAAGGTSNLATTMCVRSYNTSSSQMVYDTYNATGDVAVQNSSYAVTRYIAPMQSFWIIVNPSTTGTLSMTKSMLSHQPTATGLKDITSFPAFARLNLVDGSFFDQVVVYTDAAANAELEDYDSKKFFLPNVAQVYCPVGNDKLVINALKKGKAITSAPLTVELPSTKVYKFEMAESFVENGLVILEDRQEGIFQDMGVNPTYEFYGNSGVVADRFVLHFQLPNGTNNEGQAGVEDLTSAQIDVISNQQGEILVSLSSDLTATGNIQILDAAGRLIQTTAIKGQDTKLQITEGTGVYFVRVTTPMKSETKKVLVY